MKDKHFIIMKTLASFHNYCNKNNEMSCKRYIMYVKLYPFMKILKGKSPHYDCYKFKYFRQYLLKGYISNM